MATLIVADPLPSPVDDAQNIRKAVEGWGTDEKGVISILGRRDAVQRNLIRLAYDELYHEDLVKRLESELSGDFEKAVYRWIFDPAERDAILAHHAVKKPVPDYRVIVEIACTRSPAELFAARQAYQLRYKHSLEEDVAAHSSGDIRKLLVSLVTTYRYDGADINARLAHTEANILHDALQQKAYAHEEIIRILSTRSNAQLTATLNRYKDDHNASITKELLGEPNEEFLPLLRAAIRCFSSSHKYFEKVLRNAIKDLGTDEGALTRVVVTRAEKDLKHIKEEYYKRNSVLLKDAVARETSGDYKTFLLTLLGEA
ncbi:annexin-like protein RJ4 [Aristolochia californica]|uniref:annexin-like protein RJ4 n=1 Tax=Aristolochia californica TaxID=171875 RepID=UPI0035E1E68A